MIMEPDRYQENKMVFIVAMICLLISLTLITLSLYLLPFLLFKWAYQVPAFVPDFLEWLDDSYAITGMSASLLVFFIFFIPGIIAGIISKIASNSIENHIYGLGTKKEHNHEHLKEEVKATAGFGLKLVVIIICVFLVLFFVQWLIQSPVPYP